jgi:CRISPR-associated helicase Cas3/CRISPR-associated endonuclease Cas3-HD
MVDHLRETASLAERFASFWGGKDEARAAGLLHDLGKYTDLFQKVLIRAESNIDHATPGALATLKQYKYQGIAAALAVQGHHEGLICGIPGELLASVIMKNAISATGKTFSSRDVDSLLLHLKNDALELPAEIQSDYPDYYKSNCSIAAMLYVRMLYSALVDADFLATEAHFNGDANGYKYRPDGHKLNPDKMLSQLLQHLKLVRQETKANKKIRSVRDDLFQTCLIAGELKRGVYTLTAPTGAGKTLAMLAFALKHAASHALRRVIIVLPYLNIIEQNANVYRKVIGGEENNLILEDHSLADLPEEQRLLAENWDAPIVVTTTVRFFEGLFANRSSSCRRLHNIANSVILFDEAQSMPPGLAVFTLATLSHLAKRFGCSVVFSTATQPAFEDFSEKVKSYAACGWEPQELIPSELQLSKRSRRVKVEWLGQAGWEQVTSELSARQQVLAIVNTRKQARNLYLQVKDFGCAGDTLHLSTDMCPAHRLDTVSSVKEQLTLGRTCRLISTQCVEAGVDLDFPSVWRSLAPLEAICQAAGRCNREGKQPFGEVVVFRPPVAEEVYPTKEYKKAAVEVQLILMEKGHLDINDPDTIREYYRRYFHQNLEQFEENKLKDAIQALDFRSTAFHYRWIPDDTINILVPYEPKTGLYRELCDEARKGEFGRDWLRRARPISVGHRANSKSKIRSIVEEVKDRQKERTGWYILLDPAAYSPEIGLNPGDSSEIYLA